MALSKVDLQKLEARAQGRPDLLKIVEQLKARNAKTAFLLRLFADQLMGSQKPKAGPRLICNGMPRVGSHRSCK